MNAPIIVTALFGDADFAWLNALRTMHFPPDRNIVPAHLTLFHHLPPSLLPELSHRLDAETRGIPAPAATIGDPVMLGRGVALRVRCGALEEIRARLVDDFAGLLIPQDKAGWRPHVTIQNKVEPEEAKALHRAMAAEFDRPRPLAISGLASWRYLGGPWEPVRQYRFGRGR